MCEPDQEVRVPPHTRKPKKEPMVSPTAGVVVGVEISS